MNQIISYLPQYRPDFTNRMTYTSLVNENMESMMLRVRGCLEKWAQFCIPDELILRTAHCPEHGEQDGEFEIQTKEVMNISVVIHKKERKRFFDVEKVNPTDPWQAGNVTLMFLPEGLRMMVYQERKGCQRMPYAKQYWRGYTIFFRNTVAT